MALLDTAKIGVQYIIRIGIQNNVTIRFFNNDLLIQMPGHNILYKFRIVK